MSEHKGDLALPASTTLVPALTRGRSPLQAATHHLGPLLALGGDLIIGRGSDSGIRIDHPAVSRVHAAVRRANDGTLLVRDLGSMHGTLVNGQPAVTETPWNIGEELRLGPVALVLGEDLACRVRPASDMSWLEARNLTVTFPGRKQPAIDGISLRFDPGQFVCILGPSGAGKSTLMGCIMGFRKPDSGEVVAGGMRVGQTRSLPNGLIGYVPQQETLHDSLTVREAVTFAARLRLPADTSPAEISANVEQVIGEMRLQQAAETKIGNLSGGERKRACLAAELVVDPAILIVDEATSSLDPASEARVMTILRETAARGKLVVCVTHHLDNIGKADRLVILGNGMVVNDGPPSAACARFGVEQPADIFVKLEDHGAEAWRVAPPGGELAFKANQRPAHAATAPAQPRTRQLAVLTSRVFRAQMGDPRFLFLMALMPLLIGIVVFGCYARNNFSAKAIQTRKLSETEGKVFDSFWPIAHDAATGRSRDPETLDLSVQFGFFLEHKPDLKARLADSELDRIMSAAARGEVEVFPERWMINPMPTFIFLSAIMMSLAFMGFMLGITAIVRESAIFNRERQMGISTLAYLASKVPFLALACAFQVAVFDLMGFGFFKAREAISGMDTPPTIYMASWPVLLGIHWLATFGCASLGLVLGAVAKNPDRAIIMLGILMMPQIMLGSAMKLATATIPMVLAFLISPVYWGFRATHYEPGGPGALPEFARIFGPNFTQSVPLACVGLVSQIALYFCLTYFILSRRKPTSGADSSR